MPPDHVFTSGGEVESVQELASAPAGLSAAEVVHPA
jgi:hypothetical protein